MTHPEFTLHDLLRNSVERDPFKVAIVDGDVEYTYENLHRQSNALCAALQEAGVKKGDRVGVYMEKSWATARGPTSSACSRHQRRVCRGARGLRSRPARS